MNMIGFFVVVVFVVVVFTHFALVATDCSHLSSFPAARDVCTDSLN